MKKLYLAIASIFALAIVGQVLTVHAAPYYPVQGGTGTVTAPLSGQVLIGNGSGTYTPAYILCAGTCQVSTSSGGITITGTGVATNTGDWAGTWQLYHPSDFLSSSTQIVNSVNGLSGVITITSSSLGVVWPTINGNKSTNYNIAAGTGATSTVSGATTTVSVSLNNGATQNCSASQFVNQITSGGIVSCGSVSIPTYTYSAGAGLSLTQATSTTNTTTTYTLNLGTGCSGSNFVQTISPTGTITCAVPSGGASSTNVYGANGVTVVQVGISATATLNTAYAAIWNALETFSLGLTANGTTTLASTTNSLLVTNTSGVVLAFAGSNPCGANQFATGISATGTIACANGVTSVNGSNGAVTITSSSLGVIYNPSWLTAAVTSINGATSTSHNNVAGAGISITTTSTAANSTSTYTNTGVTSFTGQGCVTAANSTGTVSLAVTCISGNQTITFIMNGDATGTASGATSITDTVTVIGLNGKALPALATGTLEYSGGAWKIDLATSSLGLYDANGNLSSYIGSSCSGGQFVTGFSATGTVACGTPSGSGNVSSATTTVTNDFPFWSGSNQLSATSTVVAGPGGITNTGNVTTTNETVSSTLALMNVTPSGTIVYPVSVDANGFLDIGPIIGNTPGSGASTTQEFNIVEQNCPNNASTSNQSECDWSMSTLYPDGTRTFDDLNQESYPGFNGTGWFETATGASSTADAFLYPYVIEMSNEGAGTTIQHHLLFQITPVNATGTWLGATFTLTGNTTITGTESVSSNANVLGNFSIGTSTQNGNFYVACPGTCTMRISRGGTGNYGTQVFSTAGTDEWEFGMLNDGSNTFHIADANNGGDVLRAVQNGSTTIGNSGSGIGITFATAATASTTLTVNQTSTFKGTINTTITPNSFVATDGSGNLIATSTPSGGSGFTTANASSGIAVTTSSNSISIQNTGVTSFAGNGCVSAANSTGTVSLTVSCLAANQLITLSLSQDATGTATGTTSINVTSTVQGLEGKSLPAVTTGTFYYQSGAWHLGNAVDVSGNPYATSTKINGTSGTGFTINGSGNETSTTTGTSTTLFLINSGVASGTYPCATITLASSGIVNAASAGSCGGGGGISGSGTSTDIALFNTSSSLSASDTLQWVPIGSFGTGLYVGKGASKGVVALENTSTYILATTGYMTAEDNNVGGEPFWILEPYGIQLGFDTGTGGSILIGDGASGEGSGADTNGIFFDSVNGGSGPFDSFDTSQLTGNVTTTVPNETGVIALGGGNGVPNDCAKWSDANTLTDAGLPCGSGGGGGGSGVSSTTPVTSGTVSMFSGTNSITNAPITVSGNTVTVGSTSTVPQFPLITENASGSPLLTVASTGQVDVYPNGGTFNLNFGGSFFNMTTPVNINDASASSSLIGAGVGTTTIPANTLNPGSEISMNLQGIYAKPGTADNITWYFKFAGLTFATNAEAPLVSSTGTISAQCYATIATVGTNGTFYPACDIKYFTSTVGTQDSWVFPSSVYAAQTINTTINNSIDFWYGTASAQASNSITSTVATFLLTP